MESQIDLGELATNTFARDLAAMQNAIANAGDEYSDDGTLSTSSVGDESDDDSDDSDSNEDDAANESSESDSEDEEEEEEEEEEDDDDDDDAGLVFTPERSDDEDNHEFFDIYNLGPAQDARERPMRRASMQAPRRRIPVVAEESDEEVFTFKPRPRRRLPERFPTTVPTATTEPTYRRESLPAQDRARVVVTGVNQCLTTCLLFPLTKSSCLKCDLHTIVYYFASCLHLCKILWEEVPWEELPLNWAPLYEAAGGGADLPCRISGWDWWWRYVEDRSNGEIYVWRAAKRCWHAAKRLFHASEEAH